MPRALRTRLTTGVAVVGASAILAASTVALAPPQVEIPNPSVQVAASGKHVPGIGKTPVHDLVKRGLGGKGAAGGADGGSDNK